MNLSRLCSRLAKVEAQRRPWVVADVLRRVRSVPLAAVQTVLLDVFFTDGVFTMDQATAKAIMDQLTKAEFEALLGPELHHYLDTLPEAELDALANGDPAVTRKVQRWMRSVQHQGDVSP